MKNDNNNLRVYNQMIECNDINNTIIFTNNPESRRKEILSTEKTKVKKGHFKVKQPDYKSCDKRNLTIQSGMRQVFQDWDLMDEIKY